MAEVILPVVKPEVITDRTKYLFLYGSRRGGKSYTVAVKFLIHALEFPEARFLITRRTYPSIKVSVLEIWKDVLRRVPGLSYVERAGEYIFPNGSIVRFIPMYLAKGGRNERLKSATFDWIWVEEATEFRYLDIKEILMPTLSGDRGWRQMIFTFNPPPRATHWIYEWYDEQAKRGKAKRIHFSYKENPWLTEDFIEELESYRDIDEGLYKRQTLGLWRVDTEGALIYTHWDEKTLEGEPDEWIGGIDWGYNNPNAFVLVGLKDDEVYVVDEIYVRHVLTREFAFKIAELLAKYSLMPNDIPIYADNEPDRIREMNEMGFVVYTAEKDVLAGIRLLKSKRLHISPSCENTKKEILNYSWKRDKDGNLTEMPVKVMDHLMDALRYAVYSHLKGNEVVNIDIISV